MYRNYWRRPDSWMRGTYAAVRAVERHHIKNKPESSDNSTSSSHQNATKWLDLAEMQDHLKEKISEEQVGQLALCITYA